MKTGMRLRSWVSRTGWKLAPVLAIAVMFGGAAAPPMEAQTFTLLYTFTDGTDGGVPLAGVILDPKGNIYGTTEYGGDPKCGNGGCGVVFKLNTAGTETVLHAFTGKAGDGEYLGAGVVRDATGNLYGTTPKGGRRGWGTVFELNQAGKETVLYGFKNGNDGGDPVAGLLLDSAGNAYGSAAYGGTKGLGVIFNVGAGGGQTVLHSFRGTDGERPYAGLIRDAAGNLYGTTAEGGGHGYGTVFKLGKGKIRLLYSFTGGVDGAYPYATLVRDQAGNLYGTTTQGGTAGVGVVFKINKSGKETVLYSFAGGADGNTPVAGLIRDTPGNLYGTTENGGTLGYGTVFSVSSSGTETVLYSFTNGADGAFPVAGVVRDAGGNLYGTASQGGGNQAGTVFEISP